MTTALGANLTTPPPVLTPAEALALLQTHWGLTGTVSPLTSERDLNYRVTTAQGRYVLKLANPAEPASVTNLQTLKAGAVEPQTLRRWNEQLAGYVASCFRVTRLSVVAGEAKIGRASCRERV